MAEDRDKQSMGTKRSLSNEITYRVTMADNFGSRWMGPLQPMNPVAPPEVEGRRWDFPVGYNQNSKARAYEPVSFGMLRSFADNYDLLRFLIENRKDQMARREWNIVPRDKNLRRKNAKLDGDMQTRIDLIKEFFIRPDREHFWDEWLRMLLEDLFVVDAATIYPRLTNGGAPYAFQIIDGATIKPVIDDWGNVPDDPDAIAYQQILHGFPAVDYLKRDLVYRPRVKRSNKVYGYSPVEQALMTINIGMRRETWQLQSFTEGNMPEALIGTPDNWTPDQVKQFQEWFDQILAGDSGARRRARFVPGGVAKGYVPTKDSELFGKGEEWIIRVLCFAFSVSPQPFVNMMNRATAETAQETAISEGLAPIETWTRNTINTLLIDYFNSPDLEFVFVDEDELDPDTKSQIVDREQAAGRLTYNEARGELGLDPDPHPDADRPMFKTPAGWVPIFLTPEEEKEAEEQRAMIAGEMAPDGEEVSDEDEEGDEGTPPPGQSADEEDEDEEDLEKFDESKVRRHPKGTTLGGKFASQSMGTNATINHDDAERLGVDETHVGELTEEQIEELRKAIEDKEDQEVILDKMQPIYESANKKVSEPTLVLDEDGNPPEGFFEDRQYRIGGDSEIGPTVGVEEAMNHLQRGSDEFAGPLGPVNNREAYIFLGPPAAGKSTFAETWAIQNRAALIDSDEAKRLIPGYNRGMGANAVHEESSFLGRALEARQTSMGRNIVIPTVGANTTSIRARIDRLQSLGYKVNLVNVSVSPSEATRRMASRALRTGRSIGERYVRSIGTKPSSTYRALKNHADGHAWIDADGPRGSDRVKESNIFGYKVGAPALTGGK